jgi:hypothetical protein
LRAARVGAIKLSMDASRRPQALSSLIAFLIFSPSSRPPDTSRTSPSSVRWTGCRSVTARKTASSTCAGSSGIVPPLVARSALNSLAGAEDDALGCVPTRSHRRSPLTPRGGSLLIERIAREVEVAPAEAVGPPIASPEKVFDRDRERACEPDDRTEVRLALTRLKRADFAPVQRGTKTKLLL